MDRIPTVKVKSDKGRMPYRIINESDFDPKRHELFEPKEEAPAKEPKAPAKGK